MRISGLKNWQASFSRSVMGEHIQCPLPSPTFISRLSCTCAASEKSLQLPEVCSSPLGMNLATSPARNIFSPKMQNLLSCLLIPGLTGLSQPLAPGSFWFSCLFSHNMALCCHSVTAQQTSCSWYDSALSYSASLWGRALSGKKASCPTGGILHLSTTDMLETDHSWLWGCPHIVGQLPTSMASTH